MILRTIFKYHQCRSVMHSALLNRMETMKLRYTELQDEMSKNLTHTEYAKLNKELTGLSKVALNAFELDKLQKEMKELKDLIATEGSSNDPSSKELVDLAKGELEDFLKDEKNLEEKLSLLLVPQDEEDVRDAILEVRAGIGGDEACLFAENIFHMYNHYATSNGWKFKVTSVYDGPVGGYKEATALISGDDVFGKLKFESGGHRVQRVPETESSGRIHTSACTVAILPEAEEVDLQINATDLRIDTYRSSGAGGQHVNTTESAVRITHIPTGVVVTNQSERSQHENKAAAMKFLRSKLFEAQRQKNMLEHAELRASQIGSGDRSERIRTYNFPDDRVTDHRIGKTVTNVGAMLRGELMDEFIDDIQKVIANRKLESLFVGK